MMLSYQKNGALIQGIHEISWEEFQIEFGFNKHRLKLIEGLELAGKDLKDVGCETLYVDGSFTTKKQFPNDYDACWDPLEANLPRLKSLYPILMDFDNHRAKQKERYGGELLPIDFLDFFQKDRDGNEKGIIKLKL